MVGGKLQILLVIETAGDSDISRAPACSSPQPGRIFVGTLTEVSAHAGGKFDAGFSEFVAQPIGGGIASRKVGQFC